MSQKDYRSLDSIRDFLSQNYTCRIAVSTRIPLSRLIGAAGYHKVDDMQHAILHEDGRAREDTYVADVHFIELPDAMSSADAIGFCKGRDLHPLTLHELVALNTQYLNPSVYELPALGSTFGVTNRGTCIGMSVDTPLPGGGICGDQMVRRAVRNGHPGFTRSLTMVDFGRTWPQLTIVPVVKIDAS